MPPGGQLPARAQQGLALLSDPRTTPAQATAIKSRLQQEFGDVFSGQSFDLPVTSGAGPKVPMVPSAEPAAPSPQPATASAGPDADVGVDETPETAKERRALDATKPPAPLAGSDPMSPLAAFFTALPHGLTFGFNDDAAGYGYDLAHKMGLGDEIPRAAGRGADAPLSGKTDAEAGRDIVNTDLAQAHADDPKAALAGEMVGGAAGTLPLSAGMAALAPGLSEMPLALRMAAGGTEGAVAGGLGGAGNAEPGKQLDGAARGAGIGLGIGALAPAAFALPGVSHAMDWAGDNLGMLANKARGLSSGMNAGDVERRIAERGVDAVGDLGKSMEATGLTEPGILPTNHEGLMRTSDATMKGLHKDMTALQTLADAHGASVNLGHVALDLLDESAKMAKLGTPEAEKMAQELEQRAYGFAQNPERSYSDALQLRRHLDDLAYDAEGQKSSVAAKQLRSVAGKIKQAMLDSADELEGDVPGLRKQIERVNKTYETAADVNRYSRGAYAREATRKSDKAEDLVPGVKAAKKVVRERGDAMKARTLREAQRSLDAAPEYAPAAFAGAWPPTNVRHAIDVYADDSQNDR